MEMLIEEHAPGAHMNLVFRKQNKVTKHTVDYSLQVETFVCAQGDLIGLAIIS